MEHGFPKLNLLYLLMQPTSGHIHKVIESMFIVPVAIDGGSATTSCSASSLGLWAVKLKLTVQSCPSDFCTVLSRV